MNDKKKRMLMDQPWFYRALEWVGCKIIPKCLCAVIVLCPGYFFQQATVDFVVLLT